MTPPKRLARRLIVLVLTPAVGLLGAVVTDLAVGSTAANASSTFGTTITRSEVLARTRDWYSQRLDPGMSYNGDLNAKDVDGDHSYRRDCSGYVDMAWHMNIKPDPNTFQLADHNFAYTTPINRADLQPGDVLIDPTSQTEHHAVIFQGWNDAAKTTFQLYSFGDTPMMHYPSVSFSDAEIAGHPTSHYQAFRYTKIADSITGVSAVQYGSVDHVFYRGTDGALWQYYLTSTGWSAPQSLGGGIVGSPAAVFDSDANLLRVFARGTDNSLWQYYYDGHTWKTQELGGTLTSGASAVLSNHVLHVFFRGGDGSLWQYYLSGGHWASQEVGGYMLDSPGAVDDGNYLRVLFQGTDGAMWQYAWNGSTWGLSRIDGDGGEFTSGFGAYWVGGVTRVFGRGAGAGGLYQYYLSGGSWHLQSLGGTITSTPSAIDDGSYLRVFARGADNQLWQDYWNGSTWTWAQVGSAVLG